jgi:hypothetical protein
MFLVILFSLPVLTCLWWALASGRVRRFPWLRGLLALLTMGNLAYLVLVIASRRFGLRWDVPLAVHIWGYSWFLITLPFAVFPITVAETLLRLYRWIRPAPPPPALESNATAEAPESDLSLAVTRRQLLQAGVAVFPLVLTGAATGRGADRPRRIPHPRDQRPLPEPAEGTRWLHHRPPQRHPRGAIHEREGARAHRRIDERTRRGPRAGHRGLIDSQLKDLPPAVEMLSAIRATHGLYICEGNHDLFEGPKEFERGPARRRTGLHAERIRGHQPEREAPGVVRFAVGLARGLAAARRSSRTSPRSSPPVPRPIGPSSSRTIRTPSTRRRRPAIRSRWRATRTAGNSC